MKAFYFILFVVLLTSTAIAQPKILPSGKGNNKLLSTNYLIDTIFVYSLTKPDMRYSYTFDDNYYGYILSELCESKDNDNWVNVSKKTYSYNDNLLLTDILTSAWHNGSWVDSSRGTEGYDQNGFNISYLYETFDGSNWINVSRSSFTNDNIGRRISSLNEEWNDNNWQFSQRSNITYDENGNEKLKLLENWTDGNWVNFLKDSSDYNAQGKIISQLTYFWENDAWTNFLYNTYNYDDKQKLQSVKMDSWQDDIWDNNVKYTYTYNDQGNMINFLQENWSTAGWRNFDNYLSYFDNFDQYHAFFGYMIDIKYREFTDVRGDLPSDNLTSTVYPNPMSSAALLNFQTKCAGPVNITIYNSLGNNIATVLNEYKEAGYHVIPFRADDYPPGIYSYKIVMKNSVSYGRFIISK